MGDTQRERLRTLGWLMIGLGLLAACLFYLNANAEVGAADVEQTYCGETTYSDGAACDMDSTHKVHTYRVVGGTALAVAALGGIIVFLAPRRFDETEFAPGAGSGPGSAAAKDRLRELDELLDAEAITQDEYDSARRRIVEEI